MSRERLQMDFHGLFTSSYVSELTQLPPLVSLTSVNPFAV